VSFTIYDTSARAFVDTLKDMRAWLDKAEAEKDAAVLVEARLAHDMKPLTSQYQFASDSAKNAIARLLGVDPPAMPDTETTFDELRERCDQTIAFIEGVDPAALEGSETREVTMKFPNGLGYRWQGAEYLRRFALPNFYFHAAMAYAILRAQGVSLGKPDYLQHLGMPEQL
jgi:hypothetical protein